MEEFLKKLGAVLGKTYTPEEMKKILEEILSSGKKQEEKKK